MSEHRRLCMLVHGSFPIGEPRVAREAAVARDAGWIVEVVCTARDGESHRAIVDGLNVLRLPISHRRGASAFAVIFEYVSFAILASCVLAWRSLHSRLKYDVVHVHNPPDFLIAAALVPRLFGARVVFDVHDLSSDMFAMRFGNSVVVPLALRGLRLLERLAVAHADHVITVHDPYRNELVHRTHGACNPIVVMNSLDERLLKGVETMCPCDDDSFRVVYHGTVTPSYGVDLIIEAAAVLMSEVPKLRVEIFGEGDAVPALRARISDLALEPIVSVSGEYLPHREVLQAVAGASVGVIPNLPSPLNKFALSSKLFEYVALRIPVVCSGLSTLQAHFSDDEVMFFTPADPVSLADRLRTLAFDSALREHLVDRAAERYEAYRWDHSARRYADVLQSRRDQ